MLTFEAVERSIAFINQTHIYGLDKIFNKVVGELGAPISFLIEAQAKSFRDVCPDCRVISMDEFTPGILVGRTPKAPL